MRQRIREALEASIEVKRLVLNDDALLERVESAARLLCDSLRADGKALFCGNGGSAADAQHLAAELSGRFLYDRPPLPAEALHVNTSYLTAVANDYGYDEVFARMVRGIGKPGDVLVCLSTSGNSPNVLRAMQTARDIGMSIVAFTGHSGGKMKDACDILLNAPSAATPRIQELHITLGHILCELVECELFPRDDR
ncbi:MAG: D-sedoheptulose 7-phosphate isomerase [Candidatus Cloacimonetes bacterium]|nr:D-sedoheptulose 7-phosphate isomerase [Candidatus Cloacimonadota bacterium]